MQTLKPSTAASLLVRAPHAVRRVIGIVTQPTLRRASGGLGARAAGDRGELPPIEAALAAFERRYPGYASTAGLDDLRAREYDRLDRHGQIYLDYTGGGLYASSQLAEHLALLSDGVFGNPHSTNPASQAATDLVERAR